MIVAPTDRSARRRHPLGPIGWAAAEALVILALAVVILRTEGRRWWCALGDWSVAVASITDRHTSQHVIDPYSLTHVLHGVVLFAGLWWVVRNLSAQGRFVLAVALEAAWEAVENSAGVIERYRQGTLAQGYEGDSIANSLGDIGSCALGFALAARLPVRWSVGLFVGVDVGLLILYRDNLLLNVLMLVHPIDAVRRWQQGG